MKTAEEMLKEWKTVEDIIDNKFIITRIYWGFFIRGLQKQVELLRWEHVFLKPDRENEKDCFAIKVFNAKWQELGFLKRELAQAIMSVNDFDCKVFEPLDEQAMMWNTKSMFGVSIILHNKNYKWA